MFIDEKKSSSLAKFLNQFNITILDTCSMMDDGFLQFADTLENAKDYLKKENDFVVVKRCLIELERHSKDKENDSKRIDAIRALKVLKQLKKDRLVKIISVIGNSNFADNAIYTYVSTHRISKSILVITQDKSLCQDLKNLNKSLSQEGRPLFVYRISQTGFLEENFGRPELQNYQPQNRVEKPKTFINKEPVKKVQPKPTKIKQEVKLSTEALEVLKYDETLSALLKNNTVQRFQKIESIHDQLDRIKKLKEKDLLSIKLKNDKTSLENLLHLLESVTAPKVESKPVVEKKVEVKTEKVKKTTTKKATETKAKKTSSKKETVSIEDLKKLELKLMANMSNPTYSNENKIADLTAFKKQLTKLSDTEKGEFKLTAAKITSKIKELKK